MAGYGFNLAGGPPSYTDDQNYNAIVAGYQNQLNQFTGRANNVYGGYDALRGNVMGLLQNADESQRIQLANQYQQQLGQSQQSLMNRGLGNSSILDSMQNGINMGYNQAQIGEANAFAQTRANMLSGLGQAQLGYQANAMNQTAGLQAGQLAFQGGAYGQQQGYNFQQAMQQQQFQNQKDMEAYQQGLGQQDTLWQANQGRAYGAAGGSGMGGGIASLSPGANRTGGGSVYNSGSGPPTDYTGGMSHGYGLGSGTLPPATGGYMGGAAAPGTVPQESGYTALANGGFAHGGRVPGVGNADNVPIRATPGEFVLSKPMIRDMRRGKLKTRHVIKMIDTAKANQARGYSCGGKVGYATGGYVTDPITGYVSNPIVQQSLGLAGGGYGQLGAGATGASFGAGGYGTDRQSETYGV